MPYLPNLATGKADFKEKTISTLTAELHRCGILGIPYLVTHLGHHPGEDIRVGRARVIQAINHCLGEVDNTVTLLLENTAGEKNGVGSSFEDIAAVVEGIENSRRIGICFDTCHAFGAGYDLRTPEGGEAGTLHAWILAGDELPGFPVPIGDWIRGTPAYCDLDLDGRGDLVVAGWNARVYAWRMSGPYRPDRAPWPTFHGNPRRSGFVRPGFPSPAGEVPVVSRLVAAWSPNPFNPTVTLRLAVPAGAGSTGGPGSAVAVERADVVVDGASQVVVDLALSQPQPQPEPQPQLSPQPQPQPQETAMWSSQRTSRGERV